MKYLITKVEFVIGGHKSEVFMQDYVTEDIEKDREEWHRVVQCDRILLVYEETD